MADPLRPSGWIILDKPPGLGSTQAVSAVKRNLREAGFNVKLNMVETAEWNEYYSKPFVTDKGPIMVNAQHDNANGDPVFSMFFKYASDGVQSGTTDAKLDEMIAAATAATGDEREGIWEDTFAYIFNDLVSDVFLWHMVGFTRVSDKLDFAPTIRTNSELQLSQIKFK